MTRHPHVVDLPPSRYLTREDAVVRRVATLMVICCVAATYMPLFVLVPAYLVLEHSRDASEAQRARRAVYGDRRPSSIDDVHRNLGNTGRRRR